MNGLAGCYVSTTGKPHEYFDLTASAFSTEFFFLGCWFQRRELATHFLKTVMAAPINRANIIKTDVWKAHSDDASADVGSVSASGDPGGSSGSS